MVIAETAKPNRLHGDIIETDFYISNCINECLNIFIKEREFYRKVIYSRCEVTI